ncbi:MAG: phage head-tail connector protein [Gemmatimonadota bacterium]|jgi:uncharacterized phiE125 gp8 family phage protein
MSWKRTLDPVDEPVTLDELKANTRVDTDAADDRLTTLIQVARDNVERITERALLTQTWERRLDRFPRAPSGICLERPPLQSVTSLKYIDPDGVEQTLDPSKYTVNTFREPGAVFPAYGEVWPDTRDEPDAVRVVYVAGWTEASKVPGSIREAIIRLASLWFDENAPVVVGTSVSALPHDVDDLLAPYRMRRPK